MRVFRDSYSVVFRKPPLPSLRKNKYAFILSCARFALTLQNKRFLSGNMAVEHMLCRAAAMLSDDEV